MKEDNSKTSAQSDIEVIPLNSKRINSKLKKLSAIVGLLFFVFFISLSLKSGSLFLPEILKCGFIVGSIYIFHLITHND